MQRSIASCEPLGEHLEVEALVREGLALARLEEGMGGALCECVWLSLEALTVQLLCCSPHGYVGLELCERQGREVGGSSHLDAARASSFKFQNFPKEHMKYPYQRA